MTMQLSDIAQLDISIALNFSDSIHSELIFGATAATGGHVKILVSRVNFS